MISAETVSIPRISTAKDAYSVQEMVISRLLGLLFRPSKIKGGDYGHPQIDPLPEDIDKELCIQHRKHATGFEHLT